MSDEPKPCFVCGGQVARVAPTGRLPRYCSDVCRREARRLRAARSRGRQTAALYYVERQAFRMQHYGAA